MSDLHNIPQEQQMLFILAGKATITLHNTETGNRFTYEINQAEPQEGKAPSYFVSVLSSPDNQNGYTYLGNIFVNGGVPGTKKFWHNVKKSKIGAEAQSVKAFDWLFNKMLVPGKTLPAQIEVLRPNVCACCGRKLTTPESIEMGMGPICMKKAMGNL